MSLSIVKEENNESDITDKSLSLKSVINNSCHNMNNDLENLYKKLDFKQPNNNKKENKFSQYDFDKLEENITRLYKNNDIIADFMTKILKQVRLLKSKVDYFESYFKEHELPINYNINNKQNNINNDILYISDDSLDSEDLKNCINNKKDIKNNPKLFEKDKSEKLKKIFNPVNSKKVKYYYKTDFFFKIHYLDLYKLHTFFNENHDNFKFKVYKENYLLENNNCCINDLIVHIKFNKRTKILSDYIKNFKLMNNQYNKDKIEDYVKTKCKEVENYMVYM